MIDFGKSLSHQSVSNSPGEFGEVCGSREGQFLFEGANQEEPVSTPSDISHDGAEAGNIDLHIGVFSVARNVLDTNLMWREDFCGDDADWGIDLMKAFADATEVIEGCHQADGAVSTHAQVASGIEEDNTDAALGVSGRAEDSADHDIGGAGFKHAGAAIFVELIAEDGKPVGHWAKSEIWAAIDDKSRRFAAGMRVDHMETFHFERGSSVGSVGGGDGSGGWGVTLGIQASRYQVGRRCRYLGTTPRCRSSGSSDEHCNRMGP